MGFAEVLGAAEDAASDCSEEVIKLMLPGFGEVTI